MVPYCVLYEGVSIVLEQIFMTEQQIETQELIQKCLQGEQIAYSELYNLYASGIYRLCYSLLMNQQDAEDITQDSFVYAFKNLQRFDVNKASFKTWLYTIAISRCRNTYRRKRFVTVDLSNVFQLSISAPKTESPEAALIQKHAEETIAEALIDLSPNLREAIVLRYGHGLTYREIAEVMDCPSKTAESRVRLAHDKLKGVLNNDGRMLLQEFLTI